MNRAAGHEYRVELRKKFWPDEIPWTGENEKGFFMAPRTLPLVLHLLGQKAISGKHNPTRVYLELWSRHVSGGVIDMKHEGEHAFAAGYVGNRNMRTWREHMKMLEDNGFIRTKRSGNQQYRYAFMVHPTAVVQDLRRQNKVDAQWLEAYELRQMETKERPFKVVQKAHRAATKVVTIKTRAS